MWHNGTEIRCNDIFKNFALILSRPVAFDSRVSPISKCDKTMSSLCVNIAHSSLIHIGNLVLYPIKKNQFFTRVVAYVLIPVSMRVRVSLTSQYLPRNHLCYSFWMYIYEFSVVNTQPVSTLKFIQAWFECWEYMLLRKLLINQMHGNVPNWQITCLHC